MENKSNLGNKNKQQGDPDIKELIESIQLLTQQITKSNIINESLLLIEKKKMLIENRKTLHENKKPDGERD